MTETIRAAVVVPTGQPLDVSVAGQLRAAGTVTLDPGTFRRLDAANATVNSRLAHPLGGQPADWMFTLTWHDGTWKISDTQPVFPDPGEWKPSVERVMTAVAPARSFRVGCEWRRGVHSL